MLFFAFSGFFMLAAQTILLKETAQIAGANEIALGTALAAWILWTATGVIFYRKLKNGKDQKTGEEINNRNCGKESGEVPEDFLFYARTAAAVLLPVIAVLRLTPAFMTAGFRPGIVAAVVFPLVFCAIPGLLNGMAAGAALCRVPARFYGAEAAGSAAAGLFCTLAFYYYPETGGMIIAALAAAPLFLPVCRTEHGPVYLRSAAIFLLTAVLLISYCHRFFRLVPPSPRPQNVIDTRAARLAFTADGSIYSDGSLIYSPEAPENREESVHIPLLSLPAPMKIIAAGAGIYGLAGEITKHFPGTKGELLIAVPDMKQSGILLERTGNSSMTGIKITGKDLRSLAKEAAENGTNWNSRADIIFMAFPPPSNAALNRYYTREAFMLYLNLLRPDGHIIFSLPAGYNTVQRHRLNTISSVVKAASAVFPVISVFPAGGDFIIILSGAEGGKPDFSASALINRYRERKIENRYVIPENIPVLADSYRMEWAEKTVKTALKQKSRVNSDDMPEAYLSGALSWLDSAGDGKAERAAVMTLVISVVILLFFFKRKMKTPSKINTVIFLSGAWSLSLETALIFRYQTLTGELSPFLGALFAVFMAGCAAGSLINISFIKGINGAGNCIKTGIITGAAVTALCLCASLRGGISAGLIWFSLSAAGISCGLLFRGISQKTDYGPGLYSAELLGSAAGGFITAVAAFPYAGMNGTLLMAAAALASAFPAISGIIKESRG